MTDPEHDPLESSIPAASETQPAGNEVPPDLQPVTTAEELPSQPRRDLFPPWSAWDAVAVLFFTLAVLFVFSSAALVIGHIVTSKRHESVVELATSPVVIVGAQFAAYPVIIIFMMALVRSRARERFGAAIRWNWPGAAASRFLLAGTLFALMVEVASRWLPIPKSLPVDKMFSDATGAYLMAAFGVTLAPLLEELFFRGMLYPLLRRAWGVATGVAVTALAFSGIHGAQLGYAWGPLVSIFVVGVVFTLVRERTDSVASSFLMHAAYNATLFAMLWFGSDHFRHLEKAVN